MQIVETRQELRPVIINSKSIDEKVGLFHEWFYKTGHCAGLLANYIDTLLFGIIELPSGEIVALNVTDFKFADSKSKFDGFVWEDS